MDNSQHELSFDEAVEYLMSDEAEKKILDIQKRTMNRMIRGINQYLISIESVAPPFTSLTDDERTKLIFVGTEGFCEAMAKMMRMAMVITQKGNTRRL